MPDTPKSDEKTEIPVKRAQEENPVAALIDAKDYTIRDTGVDPKPMGGPWNTDDLYRKRGNYSIYEDMRKDDQISICMQIKKDLIIGNGWEIQATDEEQEEICEELKCALKDHAKCNLEDRITEIMTAYDYGFSVTEKQFTIGPDGMLCLKDLKTRDPISWLFHQDEYGNVVKYEQQGTDEKFRDINPDALIHFVNDQEFGNPYGKSDLRVAYLAWFTKLQIVKFYAIYLEKAASPIPVGKYDPNISDKATVDKIFNSLKRFQATTALMVPKGLEVEFLQAEGVGDVYKTAIDMLNMFIGRALCVPDLLGFQGAETAGGSYALGKDQILVFMRHVNKRRRTIEGLVNHHLIKPMVLWNYGEMEKLPEWKLLPINEEQAVEYAKLWLELVSKAGHVPSLDEINYFKRCVQFPETTEEEWEELKAEKEAKAQEEKELALAKIAGSAAGKVASGNKPVKYSKEDEEDANAPGPKPEEGEKYALDEIAGEFHKKTNFRKIEQELDGALREFSSRVTPLVKAALDAHVDDLVHGRQAGFSHASRDGIKQTIMGYMRMMYQIGHDLARDEITPPREDFAVKGDEFLRLLDEETANYVADWEYKVSQAARLQVTAAIKEGKPISEIAGIIHREGMELSKAGMERYARTKFTEVMNRSRLDYFESTGTVAAYQFSAILDARTSPYCRGLHGKIFLPSNIPPIPGHFGCRSMLVPITRFEDFKADDQAELKRFIEENKGKGF